MQKRVAALKNILHVLAVAAGMLLVALPVESGITQLDQQFDVGADGGQPAISRSSRYGKVKPPP